MPAWTSATPTDTTGVLGALIERTRKLHEDVRRLDATIHAPVPEEPIAVNPLDHQMGLLRAAFERSER